MRNRMYGGVRGRKTKVEEKLLRFPPTRFIKFHLLLSGIYINALFLLIQPILVKIF